MNIGLANVLITSSSWPPGASILKMAIKIIIVIVEIAPKMMSDM